MIVLLDNGHGAETPGKRSPDGVLREYRIARDIVRDLTRRLNQFGYDTRMLVPEENDIPLAERCRRANVICGKYGKDNVLLVSVHVDASGSDGQWHGARGWSCFTTRGITKSDDLARCFYDEADKRLMPRLVRKFNGDKEPDFEAGFYILKHTQCPAVLTENFFMDNKDDVSFLLSREGHETVVGIHMNAITSYIVKYGKR